jgi:hypothetical protein
MAATATVEQSRDAGKFRSGSAGLDFQKGNLRPASRYGVSCPVQGCRPALYAGCRLLAGHEARRLHWSPGAPLSGFEKIRGRLVGMFGLN